MQGGIGETTEGRKREKELKKYIPTRLASIASFGCCSNSITLALFFGLLPPSDYIATSFLTTRSARTLASLPSFATSSPITLLFISLTIKPNLIVITSKVPVLRASPVQINRTRHYKPANPPTKQYQQHQ